MTTSTLAQPSTKKNLRQPHLVWVGVSAVLFLWVAFPLYANADRYLSSIFFTVIGLITLLVHAIIVGYYRTLGKSTKWDRRGLALFPLFILVSLSPVLLLEFTGWNRALGSEKEIIEYGDQVKVRITGPRPAGSTNRSSVTMVEFLNPIDPETRTDFGVNLPETYAYSTNCVLSIAVPQSKQWTGDSIELKIQVQSEDVDKQGTKGRNVVEAEVSIPVSPEGSFEIYHASWWVAVLGGVVPMLLLGLVLSRACLALNEEL